VTGTPGYIRAGTHERANNTSLRSLRHSVAVAFFVLTGLELRSCTARPR